MPKFICFRSVKRFDSLVFTWGLINPFLANVPVTDKPGSWFLLVENGLKASSLDVWMYRCQLFCPLRITSRWIHTSNKALTLSWRRSLSNKNQFIDLLCWRRSLLNRKQFIDLPSKSMDWFLYDKGLRHERGKALFTHLHQKSVLTSCKAEFDFLVVFSIWIFFREYSRFTGQQKKGEAIFLYPFYPFHSLHRQLDISQFITAGSSPMRIASTRTWARPLLVS